MDMDFLPSYYLYCENALGPLAQPANVFSALLYIFFGVWLWGKGRLEDSASLMMVSFLTIMHGASSVYWHISDEPAGLALDIFSAMVLAGFLAVLLFYKVLEWPLWTGFIGALSMLYGCYALRDEGIPILTQNGGAFIPAFFFLAFVALFAERRHHVQAVYILCSAYALVFGVFFRSIDIAVCGSVPVGTHFMSHICAVIAIVYIVRALLESVHEKVAENNKKKAA